MATEATHPSSSAPLRADAQRNHDHLLDPARGVRRGGPTRPSRPWRSAPASGSGRSTATSPRASTCSWRSTSTRSRPWRRAPTSSRTRAPGTPCRAGYTSTSVRRHQASAGRRAGAGRRDGQRDAAELPRHDQGRRGPAGRPGEGVRRRPPRRRVMDIARLVSGIAASASPTGGAAPAGGSGAGRAAVRGWGLTARCRCAVSQHHPLRAASGVFSAPGSISACRLCRSSNSSFNRRFRSSTSLGASSAAVRLCQPSTSSSPCESHRASCGRREARGESPGRHSSTSRYRGRAIPRTDDDRFHRSKTLGPCRRRAGRIGAVESMNRKGCGFAYLGRGRGTLLEHLELSRRGADRCS